MRLISVVLSGVLLGLSLGFLQMAHPATASTRGARQANTVVVSERITWLRTPAVMRRTASLQ